MKCLIIGGNRYFGLRLARSLVEKNHDVFLLNRGTRDDGLGRRVERLKGDRADRALLSSAVKGHHWDIVFDNNCFDGKQASDATAIFSEHARRYVFTSSLSVYARGRNLREEDFEPKVRQKHHREVNSYAVGKRNAEAAFFAQKTLPVVAVRFPIVLGPDDYTQRLEFHIQHIQQEKPMFFPDLKASMSFIHSEDAAGFLEFIGRATFTGPINAASQKPVVLADLVEMIERQTGKRALLASDESSGEPSPFGITEDWTMNVDKMLALGYRPKPAQEWLKPLIEELARRPSPAV